MLNFNAIYQGDCLELMKEIPDGSIDFVCSDMPFGITSATWDKAIDLEKFWIEINRITKHSAAVALFAGGKFLFELGASNLKNYRYKIVVEKNHATGFLNAKKIPLIAHDDILIFYRHLPTYNPQFFYKKPYVHIAATYSEIYQKQNYDKPSVSVDGRRYPRNVLKYNYPNSRFGSEKIFHSSQKPIKLIEYLIKTYTNEGEVVLDATIGSGTTAVAAINTGRQFIGFEVDEKTFDLACDRITKAMQ